MTDSLAATARSRIHAERLARGWSQAELARRSGRTERAVCYWESGHRSPTLDALDDLAAAFEIDAALLVIPVTSRRYSGAVATGVSS